MCGCMQNRVVQNPPPPAEPIVAHVPAPPPPQPAKPAA